jgi:hypothetical protein
VVAADINPVSGGVAEILDHNPPGFSVGARVHADPYIHGHVPYPLVIGHLLSVFRHLDPRYIAITEKSVHHAQPDAVWVLAKSMLARQSRESTGGTAVPVCLENVHTRGDGHFPAAVKQVLADLKRRVAWGGHFR